MRPLVLVFIVAEAANFAWEMAQAPLYAPMGTFWLATRRCLVASFADATFVLVVVLVGWAVFGRLRWFASPAASGYALTIAAGLAFAVAVEFHALRNGRWSYAPQMPLVPGIDIGLVPIAQMVVLPPLIFALAARGLRKLS